MPDPVGASARSDQREIMRCPSCMAENLPAADFCKKCGMPLGWSTMLDPVKQIYAQGWVYRRAVSGPPRPIIFWGMWLLFGPSALLLSVPCMDLFVLRPAEFHWRSPGLLALPLMAGMMALYAAVLYRITKRYVRHKRGLCLECGHRRAGATELRCTQCGTGFAPAAGPDAADSEA